MKIQFKPTTIFLIYLGLILIYSLFYSLLPAESFNVKMGVINSFYFSVVTITTLGYGDILPVNGIGKISVASESIAGIILIGLFLNSLWHKFSEEKIEANRVEIANQSRIGRMRSISSYSEYLISTIDKHRLSIVDISQSMEDKRLYLDGITDKLEIKFSGLVSVFDFSIFTDSIFSPAFHLYIIRYNVLRDEMKYFLSNIDLRDYPELKRDIIQYLIDTNNNDNNDQLKRIVELHAQKSNKNPFYGIKETIKKYEGKPCPELESHSSNVITPLIVLHTSLVLQESSLSKIMSKINHIQLLNENL